MAPRISLRFSIQHLWGIIILAGIFVFINTHPIRPYDFWWHITTGKEILTTGRIPTTDIYSYTESGQPYLSYQTYWLMEVFLYGIYRLGGPEMVIFFQSLLVTSAYLILLWICKKVSGNWRIAGISVIFAAALGLNDWNVRPQGITFLLASLILLAIYEFRTDERLAWLVIPPLSMLVWVNSHGTFIIGVALLGIWWGQEVWTGVRKLLKHEPINKNSIFIPGVVFFITSLICLINPRGLGIVVYLKTLTGNTVVQNLVTEWAAPTFSSLMGTLFLSGLILSIVIIVLSPKRPSFFQVATLLIFGILGLRTLRGSVWFGLVMAPILAEHIEAVSRKYLKSRESPASQEGSRLLNFVLVVLVIIMALGTLPWFKRYLPLPQEKAGLISSETPVEATKVLLQQSPPTQVFNSMSFGSYLIWAASPQYKVFTDSRIELFPTNVWMDYLKISNAENGWQSMLQQYGVNTLMLSPVDQPMLVKAVKASTQWKEIYRDNTAIIFIREPGTE